MFSGFVVSICIYELKLIVIWVTDMKMADRQFPAGQNQDDRQVDIFGRQIRLPVANSSLVKEQKSRHNSVVFKHILEHNHIIDFEHAKILCNDSNKMRLLAKAVVLLQSRFTNLPT